MTHTYAIIVFRECFDSIILNAVRIDSFLHLDDFMTENAFEVQASEEAVNYDVDDFAEVEVDNGGEMKSKMIDQELFFKFLISGLNNQFSGMGLKENGYSAPQMTSSIPREEPEKILKWREDQKLRLEKKGVHHI